MSCPGVGFEYPPQPVAWLKRDVLLFANSIGVTADERHFLYELHPNFAVFPTYPVILRESDKMASLLMSLLTSGQLSRVNPRKSSTSTLPRRLSRSPVYPTLIIPVSSTASVWSSSLSLSHQPRRARGLSCAPRFSVSMTRVGPDPSLRTRPIL